MGDVLEVKKDESDVDREVIARFPISRVATSSMDHHRASSLSLGRGDFRRDCRLGERAARPRRTTAVLIRSRSLHRSASPRSMASNSGLGRSGGVAIAIDSHAARGG